MRRLPLLVATLVALHVALPVGAEAQERTPPPPTSAVGAARALFDALASREWSRAAAAFDSGQVAEFRQRELAVAATYLSQRDAVGHGSGGISAVGASAMADSAQIARYARTP
ncbi:MAG TPA: hypothetical protein VFJ74_10315, partial [Gemmatimonadaceae bacterium]|nr:hypothetical protein [Gemmatimonadaceae bacterium]